MVRANVITSTADIGELDYQHWSGQPPDPDSHDLLLVPRDDWEAYCSCGRWKAVVSGVVGSAGAENALLEAHLHHTMAI